MANWTTLQAFKTWCASRLGADDLIAGKSDAVLAAALTTAQSQLSSPEFRLPNVGYKSQVDASVVAASAEMLTALFEQSIFAIKHQADLDARQGLLASGVVQANVIGEYYDPKRLDQLPICAAARAALTRYDARRSFFSPRPDDPAVARVYGQPAGYGWPWWGRR